MPLTPHKQPRSTYRNFIMDSTYWESYRPRPDDIVISAPAKAGSTWTQRILSVLVFQDTRLPGSLRDIALWLDKRDWPVDKTLGMLEAQRHRRFVKTHLPMDALPIYSEVSYIVVGRDLRDTAVSQYHQWLRKVQSAPPGERPQYRSLTGPDVHVPELPDIPGDIRAFWREYFTRSAFPWETNGWPATSPTRVLETWWPYRDEPNVMFLHYQDMLHDLDGEMRRVSEFLGIPVNETLWPDLLQACTFSEMSGRALELAPVSTAESSGFFHKGRNRQWQEFATEEDLDLYRAALEPLPADLRKWLARSE